MTLKLTLDSIEGLPTDIAKEYIEQDDGTFKLDLEGLEDTGALKRAKEHEKNRRKEAERKTEELQTKLEALEDQLGELDAPGKNRQDDVLRRKLEAKITELTGQLTNREKELFGEITRLTSTAQADRLANDLSDSPNLLRPHIAARLRTEIENGKAVVKVLDSDGEVGIMTLEDLKKEFMSNKEFAPLIRAGKGSGSGAPGNGRGSPQGKTKLSDYSGSERIALQRDNPAEFNRLVEQSKLQSRGK